MKQDIRNYLESLRSQYEKKSFAELKALGWLDLAPVFIGSEKLQPAVWSEVIHESELLLVVQLTKQYFFKSFGRTNSIGFILTENGSPSYVDEEYLMNEVGHP